MLAVWAAKISEKASVHIFHRQGVTWAGKIALKIDPSILHDLAGQVRKTFLLYVEPMERRQPTICSVQQSRRKVIK